MFKRMNMRFCYQLFFLLLTIGSFAQNHLWKGYYSYNETTAVEQDGQYIYFATTNAVFVYNKSSGEREIYNSIKGLKPNKIVSIPNPPDKKKLVEESPNEKIVLINFAEEK